MHLILAKEYAMKDSNFLESLKKHIDSGIIEPMPRTITKAQIHNFGENMKGINEFIGAIQVLSLNVAKIKNLSEKIEWINELLKSESNENTITMLTMQKNAHISNIKYVSELTKFLGVSLFDTKLSCAVNGKIFSISVENPLSIKDNMFQFCTQKLDELENLINSLNHSLNGDDDSVDSAVIDDFSENTLEKIV